jgi:4-hydroxythreonine-4-phosphate dehydrogenase
MTDRIQPIVVGITAGDAAGIGPEVLVKALSTGSLVQSGRFIVYCKKSVFEQACRISKANLTYEYIASADAAHNAAIAVIDPIGKGEECIFGEVSPELATEAMNYIECATHDAMKGAIDCIVTAPINKLGVHAAGYKEKGHTEFIAGIAGAYDYAMMFVGGGLRVVLLTIHLPLKDVPSMVTRKTVLKKIELTDESLKKWFSFSAPRIAVCGLNPHSGEGGILGDEDKNEILPAIEEAIKNGIQVKGPLPADSIFSRCSQGEFDVVIAMYHDQGLIPVKALAFGKGVNITIGMPFIRTSPDHGTAYNIAGKGIADPGSMINAINLAIELTQNHHRVEMK